MHFYDAFIAAGVLALVFIVILIATKDKRKSLLPIICFAACSLLLCWMLWNTRTEKNLAIYDNVMCSDSVTVTSGSEKRDLPFAFTGSGVLTGLDKAPEFVKESDIERLETLEFRRSDTGAVVRMTLCKLKSTQGYPQSAYFTRDGKQYCFINERFPYVRALFIPNADLANAILDAAL
jgi:hypothetical protein